MLSSGQTIPPDDPTRVNVNREYDLVFWTKQFEISVATLRQAVRLAGSRFTDVSLFLKTGRVPETQRRCI